MIAFRSGWRALQAVPVSARIESVAKTLAHKMTSDKVAQLMDSRLDPSDLQARGVLFHDASVAPGLQAVSMQLERQLHKSNLFHALNNRMPIEELQMRGILAVEDSDLESEDNGVFDDFEEEDDFDGLHYSQEFDKDAEYEVRQRM